MVIEMIEDLKAAPKAEAEEQMADDARIEALRDEMEDAEANDKSDWRAGRGPTQRIGLCVKTTITVLALESRPTRFIQLPRKAH